MNNKLKTENYFYLRNVEPEFYKEYKLPTWIRRELKNKQLNILDYGCGFGQTLGALKEAGYKNSYGIDISKEAIDYCLSKQLIVKEVGVTEIKNPYDFKFDIIIISHVLEHFPKGEIVDFLTNIKNNFLKPSGKVLISVPNAQSNTDCYWAYEDWTHSTIFTSGSLCYVLLSSGFTKVSFVDIDCTLDASFLLN